MGRLEVLPGPGGPSLLGHLTRVFLPAAGTGQGGAGDAPRQPPRLALPQGLQLLPHGPGPALEGRHQLFLELYVLEDLLRVTAVPHFISIKAVIQAAEWTRAQRRKSDEKSGFQQRPCLGKTSLSLPGVCVCLCVGWERRGGSGRIRQGWQPTETLSLESVTWVGQ